ncbi:hypothetical protein C9374_013309 [Naegleria lovaniensis]|uniref:Vitellogenin domain-containing protein n=1 Tax=Naegleria lovaniensis TaxID=51637 RepID=A0AA88KQI5_NAELO|nr:uncharacterized protein C9374_013309 [Naegleria lovaniensis]KAG2391824.1 hypothetical protein C9374_013309 [Naegleria lovaniensis]
MFDLLPSLKLQLSARRGLTFGLVFVLLVVSLSCCLALSREHIVSNRADSYTVSCPLDKSLVYKFKTTTLVGARGSDHKETSTTHDRKGKAGNAETVISGQLVLTCFGSTSPENNIMLVSFRNTIFAQYQGLNKGMKYRKLITRSDLTEKLNKNVMIVVQSKSAHIHKLIFHKSESRYVRSVKKGILRLLTTETRRKSRPQTDGFGGKYFKDYQRRMIKGKNSRRNLLSITQKYSHDDFISALPLDKRQIHYEGKHVVLLNLKKHVIQKGKMTVKMEFGVRKHPHVAFKKFEKLTKNYKRDKTPSTAPDAASADLETFYFGSIKLERVQNSVSSKQDKALEEAVKNLRQNGKQSSIGNEFEFENTFSVTKQDRREMKKLQRKSFSSKTFKNMLKSVKQTPASISVDMNKKLDVLAKYGQKYAVKAGKILLSEIKKGVSELNKSSGSKKDQVKSYMESLQSLVASIKSSSIQNRLVSLSSSHPMLANNYIYASIVIPLPTNAVYSFLKSLKNRGIKGLGKKSKEEKDQIKMNAFMAYADLASRLKDKKLQADIVKEILSRISSSKTATELETYVHALNNAGKAVDPRILFAFLNSKSVADSIKILLARNLEKRLQDDNNVDQLVNAILESNIGNTSPRVKAAVINAQAVREKHLRSGASVVHASRLHHRTRNEELKSAIKNYLFTVGSERAGKELAKTMKVTKKRGARKHHKRNKATLLSLDDMQALDDAQNVLGRRGRSGRPRLARKATAKSATKAVTSKKRGSAARRTTVRKAVKSKTASKARAKASSRAGRRKVGSKIKSAFKKVGQKIGNAAKTVGRGLKKAANWVKEKAMAAINAVKRLVERLKEKFGTAKFENQQACLPASATEGDQICLYNPDMIDFVRRQGDLSTIQKAKHFSFEKLVGSNSINLYCGALFYSGTTFVCNQDQKYFDFVLMGRVDVEANLFKKKVVLLEISAELAKRPQQPVNDKIFLKVFQTTFLNTHILPAKIRQMIDVCMSDSKPLFEKNFPKLVDVERAFQVGPVPVTFHINVALTTKVEFVYGICVDKLEASASLEPFVSISVSGSANIGIPVARAGVYVKGHFSYRLIPKLAFENCKLCVSLSHRVDDLGFEVGLNVKVVKWTKFWKLYGLLGTPYSKTLFEKCLALTTGGGAVRAISGNSHQNDSPDVNLITATSEGSTSTPDNQGHHIITPTELRKNHIDVASTATDYKPFFGPHATKLPAENEPSNEGSNEVEKESLRAPVESSKDSVWSSDFLKSHVSKDLLNKVGVENMRRLPLEYFELNRQDREKIPTDVYSLPPSDIKSYIKRLPRRYHKQEHVEIDQKSFSKVWSREVLERRLPSSVMEKVPIQYLRHLPDEVLRIRRRVLEEIPVEDFKGGKAGITNWICHHYEDLCLSLGGTPNIPHHKNGKVMRIKVNVNVDRKKNQTA